MAEPLLALAREITDLGTSLATEGLRLVRKVSLLIHLLEEIRNFSQRSGDRTASTSSPESSPWSCLADLAFALEAVKNFLLLYTCHNAVRSSNLDLIPKKLAIQYQFVAWQLEKALGNVCFEHFEISDEVQEEIQLVLSQLRREIQKNGATNLFVFQEIYNILTSTNPEEHKPLCSFKLLGAHNNDTIGSIDSELREIAIALAEINGKYNYDAGGMAINLMDRLSKTARVGQFENMKSEVRPSSSCSSMKEGKQCGSPEIPEDFRCSISLELMKDPVIISTGQTYERCFIQRWIDCGNHTCPKTQQKLDNLTLTPNHVLRSLILQWCEDNKIEQPYRLAGRRTRTDGKLHGITSGKSSINSLVSRLNSSSREVQMSAVTEIRSLARQSTDNRIQIAEAGAIPALVSLLCVDDKKMQEHAVTSLLNLSIYDCNKEAIMLAGAIIPIIQVLRYGSMEGRENASAAIFSLSLMDENKITIGGTPGAIEALVELLDSGSRRGKKDAATALFNLCIYQGNKARALRAGIVRPLVKMLKDCSTGGMVEEALIILSLLVNHKEGKAVISKSSTIPLLIDLLRTGQPCYKENAASILLALCKKDYENLACIGRLGAIFPLTDISKTGTERAKRKANSLLEHLKTLKIN